MRKIYLVFFLLFIGNLSSAQNAVNSPYSSHGIGIITELDHATLMAIGKAQITMCDSTTLNFYNPASYNAMGKGQPLFSLGVSSRLSVYKEGTLESF